MIDRIIPEKKSIFSGTNMWHQICFIGHSQLDQWNITEIRGYHVRNCGVSGIFSLEYNGKILQTGMINCEDDIFLVMHI